MELAVGVLAVVVLVNLLLTFGVIRRLREHGSTIADAGHGGNLRSSGPPPGSPLPAFEPATSVTGELISPDWMRAKTTIVAFNSEGCVACEQELPALRAHLMDVQSDDVQAVVVLARLSSTGEEDPHVADLARSVGDLATIIHERLTGPIQSAFQITSYPSYFMVGPDGTIAAAERRVARLPSKVSAR